jgi:uncharacterized ferredoxin-like protein
MGKKRSTFPAPRRTRTRLRLEIVPDPDPRRDAIVKCEIVPVMRGAGSVDFECGGCGAVLCEALEADQIRRLVFACPECGAHSGVSLAEAR